jgi:hypothetical protein
MYRVHVFLGPSLDLDTAKELLPQACYHPPVQCGDIIRLFRLKPELIILIDGVYETTPAVWHKELLLALQMGIQVWGASSMGALRAAELHQYGMQGVGTVFQQFKEGLLIDDDEVAVLHLGEQQHFAALNDAMVNIRATCERAWQKHRLTSAAKEELITYCKSQFYPYRSLSKAVRSLAKTKPAAYQDFILWLESNGLLDIKKQDAIEILQKAQTPVPHAPSPLIEEANAMTCFLRELIVFANTTPFRHQATWLPKIEQQIQQRQHQSPTEYMLFAEIVSFLQKLIIFSSKEKQGINTTQLSHYLKENDLYCPEQEFAIYKNHQLLPDIYSLICQASCLGHLTNRHIEQTIPVLAHYYDLSTAMTQATHKLLRIIYILMFSINQHIVQSKLTVSKSYLAHHLKQVKHWRSYSKPQFKNWLASSLVDRSSFITLLNDYLRAYSVQSLSPIKTKYYQWIYDAQALVAE